jgi:hypothetical protein
MKVCKGCGVARDAFAFLIRVVRGGDPVTTALCATCRASARKTCVQCRIEKDVEEFHYKRNGLLGRDARCKACKREESGRYYETKFGTPEERLARRKTRVVGTPEGRRCARCGTWKPAKDFEKNSKMGAGLSPRCRACRRADRKAEWRRIDAAERRHRVRRNREYQRERMKDPAYRAKINRQNRDRFRALPEHVRKEEGLKLYGLTYADYEAMLEAQGGVCAICGNHEEQVMRKSGKRKALAVDHDHETGVVRGLLCNGCNTGIGHFREDPDRMEAAARFLRTAKQKSAAA